MPASSHARRADAVMFLSVLVVGLCTIVYELLIGTVSSYLQGDSITQFSVTIGLTMSAMGLGTYLSRLVHTQLLLWFVRIEVVLGLIGGLSVPLLFAVYALTDFYYPVMVALIVLVGVLIGLEIPLLTRIMAKHHELRANISNILSLDYFGALLATLLFPFVLLPFLGVVESGLVTGVLNLLVAWLNLWFFRRELRPTTVRRLRSGLVASGLLLCACVASADTMVHGFESAAFNDRVILSKRSRYQKIVLTRDRADVRLFLNGHLQFSSIDEYRYHEALAHVPAGLSPRLRIALVLGGGDGLVARELLQYPELERIVLVDLDPAVTHLARTNRLLRDLNRDSLGQPRVRVVHQDAWEYLEETEETLFDVILADLPDPSSASLARLYSREFYRMVARRLAQSGVFATQATSPLFAREAFWCIETTLRAAGFRHTLPYHVYVPSMGEWGFVAASMHRLEPSRLRPPPAPRFLDQAALLALFEFPRDLQVTQRGGPSTLNEPVALTHYLKGWEYWK